MHRKKIFYNKSYVPVNAVPVVSLNVLSGKGSQLKNQCSSVCGGMKWVSFINKIVMRMFATLSLLDEIICSRPSKKVWNQLAREVNQDQQFERIHLPMSPRGSVWRDRK